MSLTLAIVGFCLSQRSGAISLFFKKGLFFGTLSTMPLCPMSQLLFSPLTRKRLLIAFNGLLCVNTYSLWASDTPLTAGLIYCIIMWAVLWMSVATCRNLLLSWCASVVLCLHCYVLVSEIEDVSIRANLRIIGLSLPWCPSPEASYLSICWWYVHHCHFWWCYQSNLWDIPSSRGSGSKLNFC